MNDDTIHALIVEASLAPSVHNVQPARWRVEADGATLFEDLRRRLPAADPHGHDAAISLGAAAEGFRLAASRARWTVVITPLETPAAGTMRPVARLRLAPGGAADPLAAIVTTRVSHRSAFATTDGADRTAAAFLAAHDTTVLADPATLAEAGRQLDAASWSYMRDGGFRRELLSWMRLSRRHRDWSRDGLNAEAMAMSPVAATGARLVLGPLFAPLARIGLAKPLLAEGKRLSGDAAVILFHRPATETPFDSGAHFYRLWLRIEAAGFGAGVLAALADDAQANAWARAAGSVPVGHRLINAFRIGRRPHGAIVPRARLPLADLLIPQVGINPTEA